MIKPTYSFELQIYLKGKCQKREKLKKQLNFLYNNIWPKNLVFREKRDLHLFCYNVILKHLFCYSVILKDRVLFK